MNTQTPFYRHTSILLAIAFTAGVGIGSLGDALKNGELPSGPSGEFANSSSADLHASVIQNSAFVQTIGSRHASVEAVGRTLAYDVVNGDVVQDLGADSEDASPNDPKTNSSAALPIPRNERPTVAHPKSTEKVSCDFEAPKKVVYKATPVTPSQSFSAQPGDLIRVSIVYKNDGNTPWFADDSGCYDSVLQLGTTRELDRESAFYVGDVGSGWADNNRVSMSAARVDPGQEGIFNFDMMVPVTQDLYREYFSAMVPGVKWVDNSESYLDIEVGEPYDRTTLLQKINFLNSSTGANVIDLAGARSVDVDLSSQSAKVMLGDYVVRNFRVSSGAPKHPTPTGSYHIGFKQPARIAAESPFYIMPNFEGLVRDGGSFVGYGFHALPSLGNAGLRSKINAALAKGNPIPTEWFNGDSFWTEALDHIGSPRSHGCVRYLPADSDFVYNFTEIDTPVLIHD